jgi:CheY-like chemotaxis protein
MRTVVVDDDADMRFLLRSALERSGRFEVVGEAEDGEDGITVAELRRPDLVLLDLTMPVMDGLTALPRIREVCPPSTSVVVVSARPSEQAHQAVADGEATGVLSKPARLGQLVDDLIALLGGRAGAGGDRRVWVLPAELTSGSIARERIRELAGEWGLTETLDELELLTTELVNNAVVHAGSTVRVTVVRREDGVRVEVTDHGVGALERGDGDLHATSGRGLLLVDLVAEDWGTSSGEQSKTVWFDLRGG